MPTNVWLGLIAGLTIFLGLPVARWDKASERLRGILSLISVGVLLFLIIEVGYQAMELVEISAKMGVLAMPGSIFVAGFALGLIGLAWIEDLRKRRQAVESSPLEVATMIAIGIGLHNFAEGLAIGQSFSGGSASLGMVLVVGFALHNATEGFGIAGPLVGYKVNWRKLVMLGLIAGLPTTVGAYLGSIWINTMVELLFLALATGSLMYVTQELLRLRFASLKTVTAMTALAAGVFIGFGTELLAEVGQSASNKSAATGETLTVRFSNKQTFPGKITLARGQVLRLENQEAVPLIFEGSGLFVGEVVVPSQGELNVTVTGNPGQYSLSDERHQGGIASIDLKEGTAQEPLADEVNAVGALTVLEGHVRVSKALHDRGVSRQGPNPALDLKRAGKHAAHPKHELLMGQEPNALTLQKLLRQHRVFDSLNNDLTSYIQIAGDKTAPTSKVKQKYDAALQAAEAARKAIAGDAYDSPSFQAKVAKFVMDTAVSEYTMATEGGQIKVEEPGTPGKDNFIEYQDARGFLQAEYGLLKTHGPEHLTADASQNFDVLLKDTFNTLDPVDPNNPKPATEVKDRIKQIECELMKEE